MSGLEDSIVWGVSPQHYIYRWTGAMWDNVSGFLMVVSCRQSGVWGVDKETRVYYRTGTYGGVNR